MPGAARRQQKKNENGADLGGAVGGAGGGVNLAMIRVFWSSDIDTQRTTMTK